MDVALNILPAQRALPFHATPTTSVDQGSAGQSSANDDNANLKYPTLDRRIADTYASRDARREMLSYFGEFLR